MTAKFPLLPPVPQMRGAVEQTRIINENFRRLRDAVDRAVASSGLIGAGGVTINMLATSAKTLLGDVTGTIGDTGATTVVKIRGKAIAAPGASEDLKAVTYDHGGGQFVYTAKLTDPLTTRGDVIVRGASSTTRLAVGAANTLLRSDGTDPGWATLSTLIDGAIGSTRGAILYRGASGWTKLDPGASGLFLKTLGTGADPAWDSAGGGGSTSPLTTKGDVWVYSTVDARLAVGANGTVLTADSTQTTGLKWSALATNTLLDGSAHSDTVAGTVARGDLIVGNSTPKWARVALGSKGKHVDSDGSDAGWHWVNRLPATKPTPWSLYLGNAVATQNSAVLGINTSGTEVGATDTGANSRIANSYQQAANGGSGGKATGTGSNLLKAEMGLVFVCDFKLKVVPTGANAMLFRAGFSATRFTNSKDTLNQACLLWKQGTDTNFRFYVADGGTANDISTGIAQDTAWHDLLIYTPDNGTTWNCELDGVQVATTTSHVPTTTTVMHAMVGYNIFSAGVSNTPELLCSYVHVWLLGVP